MLDPRHHYRIVNRFVFMKLLWCCRLRLKPVLKVRLFGIRFPNPVNSTFDTSYREVLSTVAVSLSSFQFPSRGDPEAMMIPRP